MWWFHKILNLIVDFMNNISDYLEGLEDDSGFVVESKYYDKDSLYHILHKGTRVKLCQLNEAESDRLVIPEAREKKSKYFDSTATISYIDTDGTFKILEDGCRHWYDIIWIKQIIQRTE